MPSESSGTIEASKGRKSVRSTLREVQVAHILRGVDGVGTNGSCARRFSTMKSGMVKMVRGILLAAIFIAPLSSAAQERTSNQEAVASRSKDAKKLFGSAEALRVARVSSPRISPDGSRVAYLVAENDTEKEQAWKFVTHLWMVAAAGPASAARQFTRGEKSVSNVEW